MRLRKYTKYFAEFDTSDIIRVLENTKDSNTYSNPSKFKKLMKITGVSEAMAEADAPMTWRWLSNDAQGHFGKGTPQIELLESVKNLESFDPELRKIYSAIASLSNNDWDNLSKYGWDEAKFKAMSEKEKIDYLKKLYAGKGYGDVTPIGGDEMVEVVCGTSADKVKAFLKGRGGVGAFDNFGTQKLDGLSSVGLQVHMLDRRDFDKGIPADTFQYATRQADAGFSDPVVFKFKVPKKYIFKNPGKWSDEYFVSNSAFKDVQVLDIVKIDDPDNFRRIKQIIQEPAKPSAPEKDKVSPAITKAFEDQPTPSPLNNSLPNHQIPKQDGAPKSTGVKPGSVGQHSNQILDDLSELNGELKAQAQNLNQEISEFLGKTRKNINKPNKGILEDASNHIPEDIQKDLNKKRPGAIERLSKWLGEHKLGVGLGVIGTGIATVGGIKLYKHFKDKKSEDNIN